MNKESEGFPTLKTIGKRTKKTNEVWTLPKPLALSAAPPAPVMPAAPAVPAAMPTTTFMAAVGLRGFSQVDFPDFRVFVVQGVDGPVVRVLVLLALAPVKSALQVSQEALQGFVLLDKRHAFPLFGRRDVEFEVFQSRPLFFRGFGEPPDVLEILGLERGAVASGDLRAGLGLQHHNRMKSESANVGILVSGFEIETRALGGSLEKGREGDLNPRQELHRLRS